MDAPHAYYNEHDPGAAAWLRELIARGHIAPGIVDERSTEDVEPADLAEFTQCHFFAGIGVWSHALRRAGWPDDRPVWTGSCPCQPFSAAGKRSGVADERHLWPAFFHLIQNRRPAIVFGEQVASKDGLAWLDIVSSDLETSGYAWGAADLCAAGFGVGWEESQGGEWLRRAIHDCPDAMVAGRLRDFADWASGGIVAGGWHIRQRLYWVAHSGCQGPSEFGRERVEPEGFTPFGTPCALGGEQGGSAGGLSNAEGDRGSSGAARPRQECVEPFTRWIGEPARLAGRNPVSGDDLRGRPDWLLCRDGSWRPVEPGSFPLVDAAPARVGQLRGYGNALDAETAVNFISAAAEVIGGLQ